MHPPPSAPNAAPNAAAANAAIESLAATLAVADALVAAGRAVDLAGLDAEAEALCAAVLGLDRHVARGLRPALERLARQVDRLRAGLAAPAAAAHAAP
ncbi:hypothetical protein [Caldovatus aquaticus]|uniref:Uncharacterized protein n=1 Tax=Caldovatus aquaticus TaxID=2865671 RepID=A0ABS7F2J3_9PROT|nr:hypothetical protein [Caldovatus aquaticus]MBW8269831.1 hypothetical protein [Caldovatus aquaticus]